MDATVRSGPRPAVLQSIVEAMPVGLVEISRSGAIVHANPMAQHVLGLSYDQLTRCYVADFSSKTLREDGSECPVEEYPVTRCLASGLPCRNIVIGVRKPDGTISWAVYSAFPYFEPDVEGPSGAIVTFLDITERKATERLMADITQGRPGSVEAEFYPSLVRILMEHAPEALIIADGENGLFLNMNQNALELFGVERSAIHGITLADLSPPCQPDGINSEQRAQERFQEAVEGKKPVFEWTVCTPSGLLIPCEVRLIRFPALGRTLVRGSVTAIYKRKHAEQERDRLYLEAQTARDRLRKISQRLVEIQEAERRHLALELHDEIGQQLTALRLNLERGRAGAIGECGKFLDEAHGQVQQLVSLVRELSLNLRPTMLDDLGLVPALLWHFDRLAASRQLDVDFKHSGLEGRRFPAELETAAFRVIQEALTNVTRHAATAQAAVRVWATDDQLLVQVRDEGAGFDSASVLAAEGSNGLPGMRERVALLNGQFELISSPGQGTRLTAEWPLITMGRDETWPT